jgi:hypothetical protein
MPDGHCSVTPQVTAVDDRFSTHRCGGRDDDGLISPGAGVRDDRAGVILVWLSEPGAGAKQEQRLFRDLPELLSTAADGPVMGRGFSISAGQRIV